MNSIQEILCQNLSAIRSEIAAACDRSGRTIDDVHLVAVTKYADWRWVQELSQVHQVFGENRPQQLAERQAMLPQVQWHLIGQLQRNKVRQALRHAACIHSVDSIRLLERIAEVASSEFSAERQCPVRLLLQVNVTGEESKSGFTPEELRAHWGDILSFSSTLAISGLMTMAEDSDNPEDARPAFRALRQLREELQADPRTEVRGIRLSELSMGMSGDFVPAVEEGATLVRIGSRVFQGLTADHNHQDSTAGNG